MNETRPEVKDDKPPRQKRFNRPKPVAEDDQRQFIPLSMLLGGETEITPVEKDVHKHVVRQSAPSPRGWYKDKHSPKNVRPRPCYSEAVLTTPYSGYCDVGCSFCSLPDTLITTPWGEKRVDSLIIGDEIIGGYITGIRTHRVSKYVKVSFDDETFLSCTFDHPVYVLDLGWIEAGSLNAEDEVVQILSTADAQKLENSLRQQRLPQAIQARRSQSHYQQTFIEGNSETSRTFRKATTNNVSQNSSREESRQRSSQIGILEKNDGRADVKRQDGAEGRQTCSLQRDSIQIDLGSPYRRVVRQAPADLEIRRKSLQVEQSALVYTRFPHLFESKVDFDSGSKRITGTQSREIDSRINQSYSISSLEWGYPNAVRCVTEVEQIQEDTTVYDVETSTGILYANRILTHNCYVNMGTRGYKSTLLPTVNDEYPEQMDKQLAKMWITGAAYMSSYTEAFQRLEDKYHITQRLTNVFMKWNVPIFYLSRKIPPEWAMAALKANPYSYMQWSINTSNPSDLRRLSPGTFKLDELYAAIQKYSKAGIYTSFQVNPILPGITTLEEILDLVKLIADAGGNHVIIKFVEESSGNRNVMLKALYDKEIDGTDYLDSVLTDFFGHQYYVKQEIRVEWLKAILALTRELGITMATCYEYYKNGKSGASIAPWFNTADQCHGPAVPVHYKKALDQPFQALEGCFRKGCLYCEEFGTKACRNDKLIEASALQYKDYRSINLNDGLPRENDWRLPGSAPPPAKAHTRGKNPGLLSDAELWGLPPLDEVLADPSIVKEALPTY